MLNGNVWWIGITNVLKIASRHLQNWQGYDTEVRTWKNRHFSHHFGTFAWFSDCFDRFWSFKMCYGHFSRTLRRSGLKPCRYCIPISHFWLPICLTFMTWWPEMTLTSIRIPKHWYLYLGTNVRYIVIGDLLTLFALKIDVLVAKLSRPEKTVKLLSNDLWRHKWP